MRRFGKTHRCGGFTLLEMVVALTLAAVLIAIAGMGLVMGTQGFTFARENSIMAQQVQMALSRLNRELSGATSIVAETFSSGGANPYLIYDNIAGRRGLQWIGNQMRLHQLSPGAVDLTNSSGHILLENIANTQLALLNKSAGTWTLGTDMALLHTINIKLTLARKSVGRPDIDFETSVYPRKI